MTRKHDIHASTRPAHTLLPAILAALALGQASVSAFEQPKIYDLKPNDHVLVCGDSTTHDGCMPAGYVPLTHQAVQEQLPGKNIKVAGISGWSGATSLDLVKQVPPALDRILSAKDGRPPTVVVINIGLNDTGRGQGVPAYGDHLRTMVKHIRDRKMTAVLCTPTTLGDLKTMEPYAATVRTVAAELKCPVIDLNAAHVAHIKANTRDGKRVPGTDPTRDGCHLSAVGETLSAATFLRAFGLKPVWQNYQIRLVSMRELWSTGVWGTFTRDPDLPSYPAGSKVTVTLVPPKGDFEFSQWIDMDYRMCQKGHPFPEKTATIALTMDRHRFLMGYVREKKKTEGVAIPALP